MRNRTRSSGVYRNMHRTPPLLICALAALAQQPQQDPMDTAIQAVWQARSECRFEEAGAAREQARALLQHTPVDSPGFASWTLQVSQLYSAASLNLQARRILRESLDRTAPLGDSHPSRIDLLSALGEAWRQDGNLLKALEYLERAAAATSQHAAPPATRSVLVSRHRVYTANGIDLYNRLADLYQQLGRPDAVAAIAAKIRALAPNDETTLARFYEQHGQLDEAAAIYQKLADQSPDPQIKTNAWQSLANLDARQENYTAAIAATQQAIAAVQSSENAAILSQGLYQNLAGYMGHAGMLDQAGQIYQRLLQQNQGGPEEAQVLGMYAQYLADTNRGAQGESLLIEYLAGGSNSYPEQKAGVLFSLSNVARRTGDSQKADEYQQAGQALQPQPPAPPGQRRIADELRDAQTAANEQRVDDAYTLALDAVDTAASGQASDARQVQWMVPQIAQVMANNDPARAERLFLRVFALAESWAVDSMQPLLAVAQWYPRFLMSQPGRLDAVPAAIEQYRGLQIEANGRDSGTLAEPLQLEIELARSQSQWEQAEAAARELLELQESLSGNTSEPYLTDLQIAAQVYESAGDSARSLPLFRKAITVADLHSTPNNDWRRANVRMDAALALARLGRFDEADELAEEAVALQGTAHSPAPPFEQQLEQIRAMKQAAATAVP